MQEDRMRYLLVIGAMLTIGVGIWAQSPIRRDGDWEVKVEMQMPGMPMNLPAQTIKQCITPQDAADPQKTLPPNTRGRGQNDCKVSDYKVDGNKVTWLVSCPSEQMTGTGEFVYAENSYTGTMKMNARGQDMTMKYSGRRLGDCTK
jgi:Protein of unknown function (DUF3617)